MTKPRQSVTHVPIERLTAHPANIRDGLGDLTEMARSIAEHGILQPLTVTEDLQHDGQLLILAGHRRLGAARLARLDVVPVIIRHDMGDEDEHLVVMLVENTQRRDLNPIERAEAYAALRNRGLTLTDVARRTGTSIPSISYYLGLLDLPEDELNEVRNGLRPVSQAVAQARAARQEERLKLAGRPVGRPKGRATTPYFSESHPLARAVYALCDHRGVPKVGKVGCGACWEQTIRDAALADNPHREEAS
jgi:ParB family chromosome partitioning protein